MPIRFIKYYPHWLVSFTAVFTIFIVLLADTRYSVTAMLKLELAQTQQYFFSVKSDYDYPTALLETYLYFDFAFIVAFSSLFLFSYLVITELMRKKLNIILGLFCFLPGLLDVVENLLMLRMLRQNGLPAPHFDAFVVVVAAKWIVVIPFILASLTVLLYPIFPKWINSILRIK